MNSPVPAPEKPIRVLLVDDDENAQLLIAHMLSKVPGKKFVTDRVDTFEEGLATLQRKNHDVYLLDYRLGARTGLELLKEAVASDIQAPIILLTAAADPNVDLEATRLGAADYLLKDKLDSATLERSIRYSLQQSATMQALQKSNERFRLLFERSMDAIVISDDNGRFLEVNGAGCAILGRTREELLELKLSDVLDDESRRGAPRLQFRAYGELSFTKPTGEHRFAEFTASQFAPNLNLCILRDITERRNFEEAIQEISEREQRRLGQDLHDGLGQTLTGIGFLSKVLYQKLHSKKSPEAADAQKIADLLSEALSQTRQMARGLCPVVLEDKDIHSALEQLTNNLETFFGVTAKLECDPGIKINDINSATHLYRIAQEASTNSIKHGKSSHVTISLNRVSGHLVLKIQDDGVGIPEEKLKGIGMGIRVMQYRARMIGGSIQIGNCEPSGTVVTCALETKMTTRKTPAAAARR